MTPYQIREAEELAAKEAALAWRKSLKRGDQFAVPVRSWSGSAPFVIYTVERLTTTQIVAERNMRFRIANGQMIGTQNPRAMEQITPLIRERLEEFELHAWFADMVRKPMCIGLLRALKTAHDEVTG